MGELNDIKWGVIFCVGELVVGKLVCGRIHRNSRDLSKYRRPLLWNCVNKMIDISSSLNGFKASIRKSKADLEVPSFNKEIAIVCLPVCLYACMQVRT